MKKTVKTLGIIGGALLVGDLCYKNVIKSTIIPTGIIIGALGYSVYVQASKIEILAREIEELKSEKGE